MRTTLTLDSDVAARLYEEQKRRGISFRDTVNLFLREGLDAGGSGRRRSRRFSTKGFDLGPSLIGSLDNVAEVLARAEGEDHR
jgi:hypothetical protein